ACDRLLAHRVDIKLKSRKVDDVLNRLHVAQPQKRDETVRPPHIPEGVLKRLERVTIATTDTIPLAVPTIDDENYRGENDEKPITRKKKLERDLEVELEDDYHLDLRKTWLLACDEEKYDVLPDVYRGKNVADYVDPDIMKKLEQLEQEEEARDEAGFYDEEESEEDDETTAIRKLAKKIRYRRHVMISESRSKKQARRTPSVPRPKLPIKRERLESTMSQLGIDMENKEDSHYVAKARKTRSRSESRPAVKRQRVDSEGRVRSSSKVPRDQSGVRDVAMAKKAKSIGKINQRKFQLRATSGESDRRIHTEKPKHLCMAIIANRRRKQTLEQIQHNRIVTKMKLEIKNIFGVVVDISMSWYKAFEPEFSKDYFLKLATFIAAERAKHTVYPPENMVFSWTRFCQLNEVKVVILGQDPYHQPNQAHGLCFSVRKGVKPPPSLLNIFKELKQDVEGFEIPDHGTLVGWARQGVLLLNACLTVEANKANSHRGKGWETFTV
ncbi:unnamed protein product, partial [Didymodactylos carnosus]